MLFPAHHRTAPEANTWSGITETDICIKLSYTCGKNPIDVNITEATDIRKRTKVPKNLIALLLYS